MIFKTFWRRGTSSKRNFGKVWSLLCFFSWSLFSHSNYYIYRYIDILICIQSVSYLKHAWKSCGTRLEMTEFSFAWISRLIGNGSCRVLKVRDTVEYLLSCSLQLFSKARSSPLSVLVTLVERYFFSSTRIDSSHFYIRRRRESSTERINDKRIYI